MKKLVHISSHKLLGKPQTPKTIKYLIKKKWFGSERKAGNFLIALSITCFSLAFYITYFFTSDAYVRYLNSEMVSAEKSFTHNYK